jgi:hypothetical protein
MRIRLSCMGGRAVAVLAAIAVLAAEGGRGHAKRERSSGRCREKTADHGSTSRQQGAIGSSGQFQCRSK